MSRNSLSHFKLDPNIAASNKRAILFSSEPMGRSVPATGSAKEPEPGKATGIAPATKVSFRFIRLQNLEWSRSDGPVVIVVAYGAEGPGFDPSFLKFIYLRG